MTETILENERVLINHESDTGSIHVFCPINADGYAEITKQELEDIAVKTQSRLYRAAKLMFDDMVALKLPVPEEAARIFGNGK